MVQPVVSRSQRRLESKQLVFIVVLIVAVAGASFFLGVMFERNNSKASVASASVEVPQLPAVTQVAPPPPVKEGAPEQPETLTFYDNLPKGNQAPLGSGINLPPEQEKKAVVSKKQETVTPAKLPPQPLPKPVAAPAPSSEGSFVVQVASFRTNEDAAKLADRLKNYKLTAFIEAADLGDKGVWHRVLTGPYESRAKADQASNLLKEKERLSALVRQR